MDKQRIIFTQQLEDLITKQDAAHKALVSLSREIHEEFPHTKHMHRQDLLYWLKKEIAEEAIREFERAQREQNPNSK